MLRNWVAVVILSQSCLHGLSSLDSFSISLNNELVLCDHKIDKAARRDRSSAQNSRIIRR